jgi:hypothetical protein
MKVQKPWRLEMELWKAADVHNEGVEAQNRSSEAQNEAVEGLWISGPRFASL